LRLFEKISHHLVGKTFHTHVHLLYLLRSYLGPHRKTYLEIGTFFGATLCLVGQHFFPTTLYAIDWSFFKDRHAEAIAKNVTRFVRPVHSVHLIPGDSSSVITQFLTKEAVKQSGIDMLFLDGDRSKEGLQKDLDAYLPLVNESGIVVVDDYGDHISCPGVKECLDAYTPLLLKNFRVIGSLPNKAKAGLTKVYAHKAKKYPHFSYNNLFILQKKRRYV
jgi:hypothetical protein